MDTLEVVTWHSDWAWSLPLIVTTIVVHVLGLGLLNRATEWALGPDKGGRPSTARFIGMLVLVSLANTMMLAGAVFLWAGVYVYLGALADGRSSMLYSFSALTSYGHAQIYLKDQWQLMGALESLNGMILLGITTAYMFSVIQRVWPTQIK